MSVEDLLNNLKATKKVFGSLCKTPDVLNKQVDKKRVFFLAAIGKISIDNPEIESALLEAIDYTGFPEEVATELKTRICDGVSADSWEGDARSGVLASTKLGKHQLWDFSDYLPQWLWDSLGSDRGPTLLLQFLFALGLVLPCNDHTIQLAAIFLLLSTEGQSKALAMRKETKGEYFKFLKRWANNVPRGDPPIEYAKNLDEKPEDFKQRCPRNYDRAYGKSSPVPCKFEIAIVDAMKRGAWMRLHNPKQTPSSTASSKDDPLVSALSVIANLISGSSTSSSSDVNITYNPRMRIKDRSPVRRANTVADLGKEDEIAEPLRAIEPATCIAERVTVATPAIVAPAAAEKNFGEATESISVGGNAIGSGLAFPT